MAGSREIFGDAHFHPHLARFTKSTQFGRSSAKFFELGYVRQIVVTGLQGYRIFLVPEIFGRHMASNCGYRVTGLQNFFSP